MRSVIFLIMLLCMYSMYVVAHTVRYSKTVSHNRHSFSLLCTECFRDSWCFT